MSEPLITLTDIGVFRPERVILRDITWSLQAEEIVTVIGPNGAGKSTLLHIILGLTEPSVGQRQLHRPLRFGYVPQRLKLNAYLPLRVIDLLTLTEPQPSRCRTALERVGAAHLATTAVGHLSGGERQRVLLARAMLAKPQVLVLDEPVQGVDLQGQADLYALIGQLRSELSTAVVMVSHDLHVVMGSTDRVLCLNQHICCSGHPESVSRHPAYQALLGGRAPAELGIYTHHHDHDHSLHGDPVPASETTSCR